MFLLKYLSDIYVCCYTIICCIIHDSLHSMTYKIYLLYYYSRNQLFQWLYKMTFCFHYLQRLIKHVNTVKCSQHAKATFEIVRGKNNLQHYYFFQLIEMSLIKDSVISESIDTNNAKHRHSNLIINYCVMRWCTVYVIVARTYL